MRWRSPGRGVFAALAAGLVLVGGMTVSLTAQAAPSINGDLRSALNNKCLDLPNGRIAPSMSDCVGDPLQKWRLEGEVLRNLGAQSCLAVEGGVVRNGVAVTTAACDGSAGQKWYLDGKHIRSVSGGKCLEVRGGGYAVGTRVNLRDCDAAPAKAWWLYGQDHYRSDLNELCLQAKRNEVSNGGVADTGPCDGDTWTKFWRGERGEMFLVHHSLCLDILGANPQNGAEVVLWECNGTPSQQWRHEGGQYLRSALHPVNSKCLEIIDGTGGRIGMADCADKPNQKWRIR